MKHLRPLAVMVLTTLGITLSEAESPAARLPELAPLPEVAPLTKSELDQAITHGVDYLLGKQNKDGSWGSARRTKALNIYAPSPAAHLAFRSGSSALALAGLLDSGDQRPEVLQAITRGEKWFLDELPKLRQIAPTTTYTVWGHAYGLRAISRLYPHRKNDPAKQSMLKELASQQIQMLVKIEEDTGGWGYLDYQKIFNQHRNAGSPTSFTTATVLLALKEAHEEMGLQLPERAVKRGIATIEFQRTPDWSFVYSRAHYKKPRRSINRPAGSLARSPVCLAALREFGDERVDDELIRYWLHRLSLREGWLSNGRKRPMPHSTHFAISGYFYYYGFYYASECLEMLSEEAQKTLAPHLARHLLTKQETDGSWWDYPLYDYHQPYGTGYALTTLSRLRTCAGF